MTKKPLSSNDNDLCRCGHPRWAHGATRRNGTHTDHCQGEIPTDCECEGFAAPAADTNAGALAADAAAWRGLVALAQNHEGGAGIRPPADDYGWCADYGWDDGYDVISADSLDDLRDKLATHAPDTVEADDDGE